MFWQPHRQAYYFCGSFSGIPERNTACRSCIVLSPPPRQARCRIHDTGSCYVPSARHPLFHIYSANIRSARFHPLIPRRRFPSRPADTSGSAYVCSASPVSKKHCTDPERSAAVSTQIHSFLWQFLPCFSLPVCDFF